MTHRASNGHWRAKLGGNRALPFVLAAFFILCITLLWWSHQRSQALVDQMLSPMDQLAQVRTHVLEAEVLSERWLAGDTATSPEQVLARLDTAAAVARELAEGRAAWVGLQHVHRRADDNLQQRAQDYRAAIESVRSLLRDRLVPTAMPGRLGDVRRAHGELQVASMAVESALMSDLQQRRRDQHWLDAANIALLLGGALGLFAWLAAAERERLAAVRALADSESRVRAFAEATPEVSFLLDETGLFEEVFASVPSLLALPRQEVVGRRIADLFPPDRTDEFMGVIRRAFMESKTISHEYLLHVGGEEHAFESRIVPIKGERKVVWVSWDVTQRRRNEERVRNLTRLYNFLSQVNQTIVWEREARPMLQRICNVARSHGQFDHAWVALLDTDRTRLRVEAMAGDLPSLPVGLELPLAGQHASQRAVRLGHLQQDADVSHPMPDPWPSTASTAIPLRCGTEIAGVLVLGSATLDRDNRDETLAMEEVGTDVSFALTQLARERERHAVEERVRLHAAALESTQDGVMVLDRARCVVSVNRAFSAITGIPQAEAVGRTPEQLRMGRAGEGFPKVVWDAVAQHGAWQGEIVNRRRNGESFTQWASISTVPDAQGEHTHLVMVFTDITHLKRTQERLDRLAHFDPLTGLPNRLLVLARLEQAIASAQRRGAHVGLLFIDLDNFKTVNDSLGHGSGDELLTGVAHRLGYRVRREDTLGRLGGDEFLLVLEHLDEPQRAAQVAQDLLHTLDAPFTLDDGRDLYVQASIGISVFPGDGADAGDLVRDADAAMYQAKKAGRNTYRFYTGALTEAANARLAMETRLRRALEQEAFELWYQPLVDLHTERLIGLEALVRLRDTQGDPILPSVFIPTMEESGQIVALGHWVQRAACRQAAVWWGQGWDFGRMAINLSAVEIARGGLEDHLQQVLLDTGLPPDRLEVEITETGLMEHGERAEALVGRLRKMGVGISLDDFGTGYSSLAYLKRFSVDKLKIDRSFVRDIPADAQDMQLTATIIGMGRNLGLTVLAEGVETREQLEFLKAHGCHAAQGYLFDKPMTAAQIEARYLG